MALKKCFSHTEQQLPGSIATFLLYYVYFGKALKILICLPYCLKPYRIYTWHYSQCVMMSLKVELVIMSCFSNHILCNQYCHQLFCNLGLKANLFSILSLWCFCFVIYLFSSRNSRSLIILYKFFSSWCFFCPFNLFQLMTYQISAFLQFKFEIKSVFNLVIGMFSFCDYNSRSLIILFSFKFFSSWCCLFFCPFNLFQWMKYQISTSLSVFTWVCTYPSTTHK